MSGFLYDGPAAAVVAAPKTQRDNFECFWATGTGWGTFSLRKAAESALFSIKVLRGTLACRSCEIAVKGATAVAEIGGNAVKNQVSHREDRMVVTLDETARLVASDEMRIKVRA
jgi:hypothetical protein